MRAMRVLITGASSGIGHALARELAKRGHEIALLARRLELLDELRRELEAEGSRAVAVTCDVTDAASVREAVRQSEEALGGPFDLAIANAGVSIPGHSKQFSLADAEQIMRVNYFGTLYLFDAVIPGMIERGSGHFAGVASLAGLRGLPMAGTYAASKAAMQAFLEPARVELAAHGVAVTIVNPGFVVTPMTAKNRFRMPFLMSADKAAQVIADGLEGGRKVIAFPFPTALLMRLIRLAPVALYDWVMVPYANRRR